MDSNSGESPETISILVENLKETLKSFDLSILLAFTAVAIISLHGLEGSFTPWGHSRARESLAQERDYLDPFRHASCAFPCAGAAHIDSYLLVQP
jgi:hypothetical protein